MIVVGLILAIILLIVLSPIKAFVSVSDGAFIKIKFLSFTVYSYDSNVEKEANKQVEKQEKEKTDIKTTLTKITNTTNNYDKIITLVNMLKSILSKFKKLLKHTVVKSFKFNITVAGEDAADTAIKYGKVCSLVYPIATLFGECVNFKPEDISVYSDFSGADTNFNLEFLVKLRVIYLLGFVVSSVFNILKLRMGA